MILMLNESSEEIVLLAREKGTPWLGYRRHRLAAI